MKWTKAIPRVAGWYWVMWYGYEYPEVVLVTQRELEVYSCGEKYRIDCNQVAWWSAEPLEKPAAYY